MDAVLLAERAGHFVAPIIIGILGFLFFRSIFKKSEEEEQD